MKQSNKEDIKLFHNLNCPVPEALEYFANTYLYLAKVFPHYVKDFWKHPKVEEAQKILKDKYSE